MRELSPKATPLRRPAACDYSSYMSSDDRVSERARRRIREEMDARGLSQRDLADALTQQDSEAWSQPRVGKVLTGKVNLRLDEVALIARAVGLALTEVIRDRGLEFYAELTPTELRVLERLRQRPHVMHALLILLEMAPSETPKLVDPVTKRRKPGRPKNSEREIH